MPHANPVLVETLRGNALECQHRGSIAVVNTAGDVVYQLGDIAAHQFPRSSLKLVQVLPLLESGAADALSLTDAQIALACASHNGEPEHYQQIESWLDQLGLNESALTCGHNLPLQTAAAHALLKSGHEGSRLHHNCSGKHMGLISLCQHQNYALTDYQQYEHPAQQAWLAVLQELSGFASADMAWDYDGCGIPAVSLPLVNMAHAMAHFCSAVQTPSAQASNRQKAMKRALNAIAKHPRNIAGSARLCTALAEASNGELIVKTGAEGYFVGVAPKQNKAFALKIDDGATRASDAAVGGLIRAMGWDSWIDMDALKPYFQPDVVNSRGVVVGQLRASAVFIG